MGRVLHSTNSSYSTNSTYSSYSTNSSYSRDSTYSRDTSRMDEERSWGRPGTVEAGEAAQHDWLVDPALQLAHCSQLGLQHLLLLLL